MPWAYAPTNPVAGRSNHIRAGRLRAAMSAIARLNVGNAREPRGRLDPAQLARGDRALDCGYQPGPAASASLCARPAQVALATSAQTRLSTRARSA